KVSSGRSLPSAMRVVAAMAASMSRRASAGDRPACASAMSPPRAAARAGSVTAMTSCSSARRDIEAAIAATTRIADGSDLPDETLVRIAAALTDLQVRDTLYALAVGESAAPAESLWAELSRRLPAPWRTEALVLLAFSAYVRGDGPLAGVSLEAALRCDGTHRMAGMLDTALQSGLRPEQIRDLATTGYRLAEQLGVRLPARRAFRRRAG
ncbi:DUF4192 domain-containing protein, partial [Mycobacterium sp. E740]|uniref:DUF4192 domain-containing protein n=1 Tax=Mycobacterium sp. E740 TaxID=1834149 RepID=UPI0012E9C278